MEKVNPDFVKALSLHLRDLQELIVNATGGVKGVRDEGGLYHSSWKIAQLIHKKESAIKVAAFMFKELAGKHHFNDGNKRTAYCCVKEYLFEQNFYLKLDYKFAVGFIVSIAKYENAKNLAEIESWIKENKQRISDQKDINSYLDILYKDLKQMKDETET